MQIKHILTISDALLQECSGRDDVALQERLERDAVYRNIAQWKRYLFVNSAVNTESPEPKPFMYHQKTYLNAAKTVSKSTIKPPYRSIVSKTGGKRKPHDNAVTRRVKRGFIIPGCRYGHARTTNSRVIFSRQVKYTVIRDSAAELAARREHLNTITVDSHQSAKLMLELQGQYGRDSTLPLNWTQWDWGNLGISASHPHSPLL